MLESIMTVLEKFNHIAKDNMLLSVLFGGSGVMLITAVVKGLPSKLFNFFLHHLTTRINMETIFNYTHFSNFEEWFSSSKWVRYVRSVQPSVTGNGKQSAGMGTHWFFYKCRPVKFTKKMVQSNGRNDGSMDMEFRFFTRNHALIDQFFAEISRSPDRNTHTFISEQGAGASVKIPSRDLDTVVIDAETKSKIITTIDNFRKNRQWYYDRGIPYKLVILLHGLPGTGKTSLIRSIAGYLKMDIMVFDPRRDPYNIGANLRGLWPGYIGVIEDINAKPMSKDLAIGREPDPFSPVNSPASNKPPINEVDMKSMLNALDGPVPLDDKIIFITSNHVEELDPTFIRPGRIDLSIEIKPLTYREVNEFSILNYGRGISDDESYGTITGAALQQIMLDNIGDFDGFYKTLKTKLSEEVA
ncbi:AAA-ATPase [Serratia phage Moabite]|uniref:AAA-ATPase n=1 Tax=Serratia phage Moabite TaxID=2587814 RepID=A0A4Y5TRR1_9CAUD|nr:AAA-ATPase [Serratia phage Moabite]QDB71291.1 AAA-ATPase [Serratia phage Moabite]UGO54144.1 putative chaperone [Serratia phage vB_SmaM_Haymo]